jgi:colanic acid/amylovoran biosynthesis protein
VHGPTAAEDDRHAARRVYQQLQPYGRQVILVEAPLAPAQLQAAYGEMDLFIGTRLHSNIFALTRTVPVLAIAYQYKTYGVMEMLGLGDWVLAIETLSGQALGELLQRLWAERTNLRAELAQRIPQLQQEIQGELAQIRTDYDGQRIQ